MESRIAYWDTLKGGLMLLVVLGHFLYNFQEGHKFINYLVDSIYMFHMPVFVFISGYFSKSEHSRSKEALMRLAVAYLLINGSLMLADAAIHHNINYGEPYYHCWYLLALIVWRLTIGYVAKWRWGMPVSVLLAIFVGYCEQINNVLALARVIGFYPFFVAGFLFSADKAQKLMDMSLRRRMVIAVASALLAMVLAIVAYKCFHYSDKDLLLFPYESIGGGAGRILLFAVAGLMLVSVLQMPPPTRHVPLLTLAGRHSLTIYLLHRYFALAFTRFCPWQSGKVIFVAAVVASFLVFVLLSSRFVHEKLQYIIKEGVNFLTPGATVKSNLLKVGYALLVMALVVAPLVKSVVQYRKNSVVTPDPMYRVMTVQQQEQYQNAYRILFVGDLILLEDQVKRGYTGSGYDYAPMFDYTKDYIQSADLAIGVFEGPMAGEEAGYSHSNFDDGKELYLNFPDAFGVAVKDAGFDLVTTANNHLLDRGMTGAQRTLNVLDGLGLEHTGSYRSEEEKAAKHIKVVEKNGLRIAVLSYTFYVNNYDNEKIIAGEDKFCTQMLVSPQNKHFADVKAEVEKDFSQAKALNPDLIVVLPHMGTEFTDKIDDFQKTWCQIFYDNGADIIFGDHPHHVQPIEMKEIDGKMRLTAYCPGNYANIYREHDGDASVLEEVYIDRDTKDIIGGAIVPMWTAANLSGNYRPLPLYKIMTDDNLRASITTKALERVKDVAAHISTIMLGENIPLDVIRDRLYFDAHGFMREPAEALAITEEMKDSPFYKAITRVNHVCFVGDSVTEGTKNGGYGWYEPMITYIKNVSAFAKGSQTSKWLLDNAEAIANKRADLYVVAIGCNDIRYRNPKVCAMTAEDYAATLQNFVEKVRIQNEQAQFIFIAPWTSTDGDKNSQLDYREKMAMYQDYDEALQTLCIRGGYMYVNPNPLIEHSLRYYLQSDYLNDFIHPNSKKGIQLYSRAVMLASDNR